MNGAVLSAYPTCRAAWLAGACVLAAVAFGVAAPARWPLAFLFSAGAALLIALDYVRASSPADLELAVGLPASLAQGAEADVRVTAAFRRAAPPRLEAALTADDRVAVAPRTRPVEAAAAAFRLRAVRRGRAKVERLQARWTGPLGLVRRQCDLPLDREVAVTPDLAAARAASRSLGDDALGGPRIDPRRGQGGEFEALRAYQAGDERRLIDWKRSASRGALLVKDFQFEQNHPVVLALDCGRQMQEPIGGRSRLDQALSAALALAYAGLSVGDRVKLCGFDAAVRVDSPFAAGRRGFAALQAASSRLEPSTEATNYTLALHTVAAALDRRSLVVVFTEFTDTVGAELMLETAGRLVRRHVVMFVVFRDAELEGLASAAPEAPEDVSRTVIAASLLRERRLVLERLRRMGVQAVETTPERMGGAVVDAYLDLKRRQAL